MEHQPCLQCQEKDAQLQQCHNVITSLTDKITDTIFRVQEINIESKNAAAMLKNIKMQLDKEFGHTEFYHVREERAL